jgi:prephenate dehydrogenase
VKGQHVVAPGQRGGEPPLFPRIAIVGCGLIGGSLAMAARQRWPESVVVGVDRREVLETAMRLRAIDVGAEALEGARDADLIVLAAPVKQNIEVLGRLAAHVRSSALVTDVGGTKVTTADAGAALPARLRFIGGHPLAGAAIGGVHAARADLFDGRPWLLAVADDTGEDDLRRLEAFVTSIGAIPRRLRAEEHDSLLEYLSHLPQLAASAMDPPIRPKPAIAMVPNSGGSGRGASGCRLSPRSGRTFATPPA